MKISLVISALIFIAAAAIGLPRLLRLQVVKNHYHELEEHAQDLGISPDSPSITHSNRSPTSHKKATSPETVNHFTSRIVDHLGQSGTTEEQNKIISELITLSPSDWTLLVQQLAQEQTIEKDAKINFLKAAFMTLFRDYPAAGLSLTMEMGQSFQQSGKSYDSKIQVTVSCLTGKDPESAAQWALDHPAQAAKFSYLGESIIRSAVTKDPHLALRLIKTLNLSDDPQSYLSIGRGIDKESAHNFINFVRSGALSAEQKNQALVGIASSELIKDFDAATSWFLSSDLTAEEQLIATQNLNYYSVKKDTSQWLDWLTKRDLAPVELIRRQTKLLEGWSRQDFAAASNWLNQQPAGESKNAVVKTFAEALSYNEPEAAADWATTLPDGQGRTKLLQTIHSSLKEKDPAAAATLAEKHQLKID